MTSWSDLRALGGLYWAVLAVFGAVAGSFASAAIHRLPRGSCRLDDPPLSLWRPARSFCPHCRSTIRWHDNVPILSWVLLAGRCRSCRRRISASYLVHELALAGLFVLAGASWPAEEGFLAMLLVGTALTGMWIAALVDWKWKLLPDAVTIGGIASGVLAALLVPRLHLWDPADPAVPWGARWLSLDPLRQPALTALVSSVTGAAVSALFFFVLGRVFSYLLRQDALGSGDVLYLAAVGAWLGLEGSAWTLFISVAVGSVLGLVSVAATVARVAAHRRRRGAPSDWRLNLRLGWAIGHLIPFGPALVFGTVLVLLQPLAARGFFLETWPSFLQRLLT